MKLLKIPDLGENGGDGTRRLAGEEEPALPGRAVTRLAIIISRESRCAVTQLEIVSGRFLSGSFLPS